MKYTVKIEIANRFNATANELKAEGVKADKEIKTALVKKASSDLDFAEAPTVLAIKNAVAEKYPTINLFSVSVLVKDVEKTDDAEVITDTQSISYRAMTGISFEEEPKTDSAKKVAKLAREAKASEPAPEVTAFSAARSIEPLDKKAEAAKRIEDLKAQWEAFRANIK
jgi:hypothetical protein